MTFWSKLGKGIMKGVTVADSVADATGLMPAPIDKLLDVTVDIKNDNCAKRVAANDWSSIAVSQLAAIVINGPAAVELHRRGYVIGIQGASS